MASSGDSLVDLCRQHGVLALYLFGSRSDDGLKRLAGEPRSAGGSDLDIGIVFDSRSVDYRSLNSIQGALEDVFAPLRVDLVPLDTVDSLFQFAAIDGHRVAVTDSTKADMFELDVMRRAAELLPVQRQLERELFGVTTR